MNGALENDITTPTLANSPRVEYATLAGDLILATTQEFLLSILILLYVKNQENISYTNLDGLSSQWLIITCFTVLHSTTSHSNHVTSSKQADTLICHTTMRRNPINFLYNPGHVTL